MARVFRTPRSSHPVPVRPGVTRKALLDLEPPLQTRLPLVLVAVRKVRHAMITVDQSCALLSLLRLLSAHPSIFWM